MMKRFIATIAMAASASAFAAGSGYEPVSARVNLDDEASLQRGAKLFVNYCLSCHSAAFMRYNRTGADLGLTDAQVAENLMFTTDKVGNAMTVAMSQTDAERWFGVVPPDLSVIARSRGADWLYTYMMTFYRDDSRPNGVNNLMFPAVGMPHVMERLQGVQQLRRCRKVQKRRRILWMPWSWLNLVHGALGNTAKTCVIS